MYRIVFLILISASFFGCANKKSTSVKLPFYNDPDFTPVFIENDKEVGKLITHTISDFAFLNQDSILIDQSKVEDKIHVANFIFTSCGSICPVMTRNLKIVSDSLKNESNVILLSYSVTPWIDSPSVLKKYKSENGINNPNWHFLTGSKSDIYTLARKAYFAEESIGFSKDSTEFLHTEHFILVDKNKHIRGIYNGTLELEMFQLLDDIHSLQQE
jgi:protein SCO1/2